jgi:hypothetical protein
LRGCGPEIPVFIGISEEFDRNLGGFRFFAWLRVKSFETPVFISVLLCATAQPSL